MPGSFKTRRSCCAASATARPTASSTSTRATRGRVGRDREGVAAAEVALRRPAGAVLPARPGAPRGPRRLLHGDRRLDRRRATRALRSDGAALGAAARACDAVLRLLDSAEPNPPAYNLLCRYLDAARRRAGDRAAPARPETPRSPSASSWRWRPASRPSSAPAPAAARPSTSRLLGRRRRRRLRACEGGGFPLAEEAHRFMVEALGRPLARGAGRADRRALRQADRAITETLEHHAHVQPARRRLSTAVDAHAGARDLRGPRIRAREDEFLWEPGDAAPTRPRRREPEPDSPAAHAVPARPRPDRPLEGVPAPQAQDPGLRRARGRPLPHPAHPHARGLRHRAHGRAGAAASTRT